MNGKHSGHSPTSIRGLAVAEKRRKALDLRKAGASFDSIAQELGYKNRGAAYKAIMAVLKLMQREPAAEVRKLELERLDRLFLVVWPLALKGDMKAVDRCLQIARQRAALEGLNLEKVALTDPTGEKEFAGGPKIDVFAEIERYRAEFEAVARWTAQEAAEEEISLEDMALAGFSVSAMPSPTEPESKPEELKADGKAEKDDGAAPEQVEPENLPPPRKAA
jgi:hypothetical protein